MNCYIASCKNRLYPNIMKKKISYEVMIMIHELTMTWTNKVIPVNNMECAMDTVELLDVCDTVLDGAKDMATVYETTQPEIKDAFDCIEYIRKLSEDNHYVIFVVSHL